MIGQTTHHEELDGFLAGLPEDRWAMVMRYREMETRGINPRVTSTIDTMLTARADDVMPEAEKHEAQKRLFNLVLSATREGNDQVQVYTDRIWGRLSPDERRQLATNSTLAPSIIMEAMRNDPLLAPRIVVQVDQTTTRGIEAYQGSAAAGGIGMHYASLREQDSARSAEARQFADLGISRADAATFASIGLDRIMLDRYLCEGFSQGHITAAARDANTLGFRGREDIDIAMRAPSDLRAAAAALARARTDEERAAAQRAYDALVQRYQDLPPNDPRRQHAIDFIQRVDRTFGDMAARIGDDGVRAATHDQMVAANVDTIGRQEFSRIQADIAVRNDRALSTQQDEQRIEAALADFGLDPAPAQHAAAQSESTPDAVVTADATPTEGGTTRTADAAAVTPAAATVTADANPASTTPVADNRTRVARAPVRLPSATV